MGELRELIKRSPEAWITPVIFGETSDRRHFQQGKNFERFMRPVRIAAARMGRKKYKIREKDRHDVPDCLEFFCNPRRKHVKHGMLSLVAFEQQQKLKLRGIQETRGQSHRARQVWRCCQINASQSQICRVTLFQTARRPRHSASAAAR